MYIDHKFFLEIHCIRYRNVQVGTSYYLAKDEGVATAYLFFYFNNQKFFISLVMFYKAVLFSLFTFPLNVFAEVIHISYGANLIDIDNDGRNDLIVRTRGETLNAHSFDRYIISYQNDKDVFYEVALEDTFRYEFVTHEGADCKLRYYMFEKDEQGLKLTQLEREFGESYADTKPVTVTTYRFVNLFKKPDLLSVGIPPYFLKKQSTYTTETQHCDVKSLMQ